MATEEAAAASVISDPFALAGGYMVIISVEAIRKRTADRWSAKQDAVWEFARRQFEKSFPKTDAIRKLTDVEYLVAQASAQGAAAQFKAIDLLRSILTFFLGVANLSELSLSIVRSIKDGVIEAEALSEEQIQTLTSPPPDVSAPLEPAPATHLPSQFRFDLKIDRAYQVVVSVDPIWTVYKRAVASYHLRPLVFEDTKSGLNQTDPDEISLRDLVGIDLAVLRSAAAAIREEQSEGRRFALHVPVHLRCLRSPSCRSEMARILPSFADIRRFLVFHVLGVPDGAPRGALAEAISALRPHGVAVIMQPASMNGEVRRWRGLGLAGIAYDFIDDAQTAADAMSSMKEFGAICAGVSSVLIGHAIATRPMLLAAIAAGFTHISGAPISEKLSDLRAAVRFLPEDIYS